MADLDGLDQLAGQLRIQQEYWEAMRQKAAHELEQQRDDERAKSQLSAAGFNLDEISKELNRIERLKEAAAKENDPGRDDALKEEFAKQEAFKKEEQQKADFQKEEQQKA